jgi:hypothetical protein
MDIHLLLAGVSLALFLCALALVREVRLRRALQVLLKRLLEYWRSHAKNQSTARFADRIDDSTDERVR